MSAGPTRRAVVAGGLAALAASGGPRVVFADDQLAPLGLRIRLSRDAGVAPLGVHASIEADGMSPDALRAAHRLWRVDWDFGERYRYRSLPETTRAVREAGRPHGPFAAHVYETDGADRNVIVRARVVRPEDGATAVLEAPVRVGDPDRFFDGVWEGTPLRNPRRPGRFTAVVSQRGDFTGAPRGAARFTDPDLAFRWLVAKEPWARRRLLLRAGETFIFGRQLTAPANSRIGRFGPGGDPNPVLRRARDFFWERFVKPNRNGHTRWGGWSAQAHFSLLRLVGENIAIGDLDFRGDYDASRPSIFPGGGHEAADWDIQCVAMSHSGGLRNATLNRCSARGLFGLFISATLNQSEAVILSDCAATDWWNYAVYTQTGRRYAYLGCAFMQNPNAVPTRLGDGRPTKHRNVKGERNVALHGPLREAQCERGVVWACHFDSRTDWSANAGRGPLGGEQPALRLMTTNVRRVKTQEPQSVHVGGCHLRGGYVVAAAVVVGSEAAQGLPIFDGNYVEAGRATTRIFGVTYPEAQIRANICVAPDRSDQISRQLIWVEYGSGRLRMAPALDGVEMCSEFNTLLVQLRRLRKGVTLATRAGAGDTWPQAKQRGNLVVIADPDLPVATTFADDVVLSDLSAVDDHLAPVSVPPREMAPRNRRLRFDFIGEPRPLSPRPGALEPTTVVVRWRDLPPFI